MVKKLLEGKKAILLSILIFLEIVELFNDHGLNNNYLIILKNDFQTSPLQNITYNTHDEITYPPSL